MIDFRSFLGLTENERKLKIIQYIGRFCYIYLLTQRRGI
jgi:phosphorylcholine metabolism protein LicD